MNLQPGFFDKAVQWQSKVDGFLAAYPGNVVFMGHSMGGAVASIAAVYARTSKGRLNVAIVSEGMCLEWYFEEGALRCNLVIVVYRSIFDFKLNIVCVPSQVNLRRSSILLRI